MIHAGTLYQYYFFHHNVDRHFFEKLNVAIPTGSTDGKNSLSCQCKWYLKIHKENRVGEIVFSLSSYYIKYLQ